jgi:TPR repeat protein
LRTIASKSRLAVSAILCAAAVSANAAPSYVEPNRQATEYINRLLKASNCKGAIEEIKSGVKSKQPDVLLLAGTLYEEGMCVAPNWEKAVGLYMMADDAGNKSAVLRLIAGYARAGRDNGLALWWTAKSRFKDHFPKPCIPASHPDDNPDGFNDELGKMPAPVFQACVYLVGVVGELRAQFMFPQIAADEGISGSVIMAFAPSSGRISWFQDILNVRDPAGGRFNFYTIADRKDPRMKYNSLLLYLKGKGECALSRYQRPAAGFDPSYVYSSLFTFSFE